MILVFLVVCLDCYSVLEAEREMVITERLIQLLDEFVEHNLGMGMKTFNNLRENTLNNQNLKMYIDNVNHFIKDVNLPKN